jgi:hypothetical protein
MRTRHNITLRIHCLSCSFACFYFLYFFFFIFFLQVYQQSHVQRLLPSTLFFFFSEDVPVVLIPSHILNIFQSQILNFYFKIFLTSASRSSKAISSFRYSLFWDVTRVFQRKLYTHFLFLTYVVNAQKSYPHRLEKPENKHEATHCAVFSNLVSCLRNVKRSPQHLFLHCVKKRESKQCEIRDKQRLVRTT